jgi:hypothetical protein
MTSVDADLRIPLNRTVIRDNDVSGRRSEIGRRPESIIYIRMKTNRHPFQKIDCYQIDVLFRANNCVFILSHDECWSSLQQVIDSPRVLQFPPEIKVKYC